MFLESMKKLIINIKIVEKNKIYFGWVLEALISDFEKYLINASLYKNVFKHFRSYLKHVDKLLFSLSKIPIYHFLT